MSGRTSRLLRKWQVKRWMNDTAPYKPKYYRGTWINDPLSKVPSFRSLKRCYTLLPRQVKAVIRYRTETLLAKNLA